MKTQTSFSPWQKKKKRVKLNKISKQGTEDTAVPIQLAVRSANIINTFGRSVNLTANLTRLQGQEHMLVTPRVMNAIEEYVSERAEGTVRFLTTMVNDLSDSFQSVNQKIDRSPFSSVRRIVNVFRAL